MSITLPPLPPTDTEIEDAAHSALQEALAFGVGLEAFHRPLRTLAKQFRAATAAVEADRASRVPMTDDPRVEDLAMLVKRLVHDIRRISPDNVSAYSAMGYLDRMGLIGSPLRKETTDGLELAAKWVEKRLADYDDDHGSTDPETGTREYGRNGAGEEYVGELQEIIEGIRGIGAKP